MSNLNEKSILESQIELAEKEWLNLWKEGPTRLRWNKIPLQVGDLAPDFKLQDSTGKMVHLQDYWNGKPALVLFWRHFGCSCGIDRIQRLKNEYAEYIRLGANVVIVGQGEPERSAIYAQKHDLPCPILSDPEYKAYQGYDLLEGKPSQILFDASDEFLQCDFKAGLNLQKSRTGTDRATVDNPWQLPGEFVVDNKGIVRLAYRYQYCEDWPEPLVLLSAIKEAIWEIK